MSETSQQHPTHEALFVQAERFEHGRVDFGSEVATHVASCPKCSAEVARIRESIRLTQSLDELEPTGAMEASVLLALKSHRPAQRHTTFARAARSAAVVVVFIGVLSTTVRHDSIARDIPEPVEPVAETSAVRDSVHRLVVVTPEEVVIEPALQTAWEPKTRWERAQWRAIETMDDDIDEALEALESNPAWVRAGSVVSETRELKSDRLKTLYAERTL